MPEQPSASSQPFFVDCQIPAGMVDTAAEGGLVGKLPFNVWNRNSPCGGFASSGFLNRPPQRGLVQGDVPLLLPVRLLAALEVLIDMKHMVTLLQSHDITVPLHQLPSGHVTVNILRRRQVRGSSGSGGAS